MTISDQDTKRVYEFVEAIFQKYILDDVSNIQNKEFVDCISGNTFQLSKEKISLYKIWNHAKNSLNIYNSLGKLTNTVVENRNTSIESVRRFFIETQNLKRFASDTWKAIQASEEKKMQFLDVIVNQWGGMQVSSPKTWSLIYTIVNQLDCQNFSELAIKLASTTKALAMVYPNNCFVYDSRISLILNILLDSTYRFPLFQGESKHTQLINKQIENKKNLTTKNPYFYHEYCQLIQNIFGTLQAKYGSKYLINAQAVELLLFIGSKEYIESYSAS